MQDEYLLISGIQHFCFCPRQWALIHIEQQWTENYLTAEGRIGHNRVHDNGYESVRNGVHTIRGLYVKSEILKISGICDAVEFYSAEDGITLHNKSGLWDVVPVEYKHGKIKANDCDRLQLTAQALCLEEMFCCRIKKGYLFYQTTKRREEVLFTNEIRQKVTEMLQEMQRYYQIGYTPKTKPFSGCKQCSLSDLCLPVLQKKKECVADYIAKSLGEIIE